MEQTNGQVLNKITTSILNEALQTVPAEQRSAYEAFQAHGVNENLVVSVMALAVALCRHHPPTMGKFLSMVVETGE